MLHNCQAITILIQSVHYKKKKPMYLAHVWLSRLKLKTIHLFLLSAADKRDEVSKATSIEFWLPQTYLYENSQLG